MFPVKKTWGVFLQKKIVIGGGQQLQHGSGAQIGAADADDDEHRRLVPDDPGGLKQPLELSLVIRGRELHPAGEFPSQAVALLQQVPGLSEAVQAGGEPKFVTPASPTYRNKFSSLASPGADPAGVEVLRVPRAPPFLKKERGSRL